MATQSGYEPWEKSKVSKIKMAVFTKLEFQIQGVTIRCVRTTGSSKLLAYTGPECLFPSSFIHRSSSGVRSGVRQNGAKVWPPGSWPVELKSEFTVDNLAPNLTAREGVKNTCGISQRLNWNSLSLSMAPIIITHVGFYSVQLKFFGTINQIQIILRVWTF